MTNEDFFNQIIISDDEKIKAMHYLQCRGIDAHIFVCEYLQGFKLDKVTYSEVATAFRYDKRIRRIIYKYIGFFEEYIRAFIANRYDKNINNLKLISKLKLALDKEKKLFAALDTLSFGELFNQIKVLPQEDINELFFERVYNEKDLAAVVELRNAVSHNRFLLHNKQLKQCSVGGNTGCSLWANITNFKNYLPKFLKDAYVYEIKKSQNGGENKYANQSEWSLIYDIIITL